MIGWAAFLGATFACALTVALLIRWAGSLGLVDHPTERKDHSHPIPVVGGVGILIGLLVGFSVVGAISPPVSALLSAGALLICIGVVDDLRDVHWMPRIFVQILSGLILVVLGGVVLLRMGRTDAVVDLALGMAAVPFTLFAVVGLINAVNMVDGLDGLAGVLTLSSLAIMAVFAQIAGNSALQVDLLICIGAVFAFLIFNLRFPGRLRAHAFLGNGGSAFLGLMLAWAAVRLSHEGPMPTTPALAPWLVAVPILDCLGLIARRLHSRRSPFAADRNHLHHLLLDRGLTVSQVVTTCVALHLALAGIGVALAVAGTPDWALIAAFVGILGIYGNITTRLDSSHERLGFMHAPRPG